VSHDCTPAEIARVLGQLASGAQAVPCVGCGHKTSTPRENGLCWLCEERRKAATA
jgi:hypothetical protein